jgi:hypothetical protein
MLLNEKSADASNPILTWKNLLPIIKRTIAVSELNNTEGNLTANAPIPKSFIQKWRKIKCKGGLFSLSKIL